MIILFWISLFVIFYTYIGYGILLFVLVRLKRKTIPQKQMLISPGDYPSLTMVIAAYNEESIIGEKIRNTLSLQYPAGKISYVFVTDGSTDGTPDKIAAYPQLKLMHSPERRGKINAIHRVMNTVTSEIVVFTDANTFLNEEALMLIAAHYQDQRVGAVSGEKRVQLATVSDATAGEGFYWKYESKLKKWDSALYSVVGAAGELFSIRTSLYEAVEEDTILDDFMISMRIAAKGYRIVYEPRAYAMEDTSENTGEELKRKIRIAAGGIQSVVRLKQLLNPVARPLLSFQYISHRVLRWTITPFLMILALLLNILIVYSYDNTIYRVLLTLQVFFYLSSILGWIMEKRRVRLKLFFIPFYFCLMNYAVFAGMIRYFSGKQKVAWEKAKRKQTVVRA